MAAAFDILLLDRDNAIAIVECKQSVPSPAEIQQLRGCTNHEEKLRTGLPGEIDRNLANRQAGKLGL